MPTPEVAEAATPSVVGEWCLNDIGSESMPNLPPSIEGETWTFGADGRCALGDLRVAYTHDGDRLSIEARGPHRVVTLDDTSMELEAGGMRMRFTRECLPIVRTTRLGYELVRASMDGNEAEMLRLLGEGALPDAVDDRTGSGVTALAAAARANHIGAVRLLLGRGANARLRSDGYTARDRARAQGSPELLALLEAAEATAEDVLAFQVASAAGTCPDGYRALFDVCVHPLGLQDIDLRARVDAYRRGALPPLLTGAARPSELGVDDADTSGLTDADFDRMGLPPVPTGPPEGMPSPEEFERFLRERMAAEVCPEWRTMLDTGVLTPRARESAELTEMSPQSYLETLRVQYTQHCAPP